MTGAVGHIPRGGDAVDIVELECGDMVLFEQDNSAAFIRADPGVVIDLSEVWGR